MTANELRQQRAKKIHDAREILNRAEAEGREPTSEQLAQFDRLMAEADALETQYTRLERLETQEAELATSQGRRSEPAAPGAAPRTPPAAGDELLAMAASTGNERLSRFLSRVATSGTRLERETFQRLASDGYRRSFTQYLMHGLAGMQGQGQEHLALQADSDTQGGYLLAPLQMVNDLIQFVSDLVFIRGWATVQTVTSAQALGAPSLDTDIADSDWTSEILTGSEDSSMALGRRELSPHPLAKLIKVSNKLLRATAGGAERLVLERLGYKFALTEEKAFLSGSGANQPLGVFTANAQGISTSRDVSTDNTTTTITADGLINAKYSLKAQYQQSPGTRWVFHRDAVKMIRKLKDGNGQYLWAPGLAGGEPDRILDVPFAMSEHAPNTFTTGLYVGIIGDFRFYWIADALQVAIQRLVELYAATNQVGFIGRRETDGMPVLEEAFARVKLA